MLVTARAVASTMVPTRCPPHTPLPPAPRGRYGPSPEIPPLSLIPPWAHLSLPLGFLAASCHLQCDKSSERLGLLSLQPIEVPVVTSPPLPGTGWDPSSLGSEAGPPWWEKQETFLPGPPTESLPTSFLYLDCLTKLLAGTSLQTMAT